MGEGVLLLLGAKEGDWISKCACITFYQSKCTYWAKQVCEANFEGGSVLWSVSTASNFSGREWLTVRGGLNASLIQGTSSTSCWNCFKWASWLCIRSDVDAGGDDAEKEEESRWWFSGFNQWPPHSEADTYCLQNISCESPSKLSRILHENSNVPLFQFLSPNYLGFPRKAVDFSTICCCQKQS